MASPTEHYRAAEQLLDEATDLYAKDMYSKLAGNRCALAKIHAQLATAGAALFGPALATAIAPSEALRLSTAMRGGVE